MQAEDKPQPHSELAQMARDFQDLLDSRGWAHLNRIVAEQLEARVQNVMLVPAGSGDANPISAVLNAEYLKGEYNGQVSVMHLPKVQIDMIENTLQREETEDGTGNSTETP
jgi:hypothetical protein